MNIEVKAGMVVVSPHQDDRKPKYADVKPLDLYSVKYVETPNKSARKDDVQYIVLHHTGPGTFNGIVNWLTNPQAKASAHYVLGTRGELNQLANTRKYKAWHAGVSEWQGLKNLNRYSVGIEICNIGVLQKHDDGHYYYEVGRNLKKYTGKVAPVKAEIVYPSGKKLEGYAVPYPEAQLKKLVALCKGLVQLYPNIKAEHFITHYQIGYPEGRKNDPFGLDVNEIVRSVLWPKN